ncbi:hypothetical protein QYE76_034137 [Lolium multiflorum]|uniref:Reverse transcriptase domain-containing protein n=1 Tax=Lolium multiflorum TaxID=4521 RepID=A0AAD8QZ09_LOLMU|nr:hypothetical protein QYE76_034137 [Lolium multiflorum]
MDMAFGKFHFRVGKEGSHRLARSDSARSGAAGSDSSGSVSSFESGDEEISSAISTNLASSGELIKIFSNISVGSSADSNISSDSDSVDAFDFIDRSTSIREVFADLYDGVTDIDDNQASTHHQVYAIEEASRAEPETSEAFDDAGNPYVDPADLRRGLGTKYVGPTPRLRVQLPQAAWDRAARAMDGTEPMNTTATAEELQAYQYKLARVGRELEKQTADLNRRKEAAAESSRRRAELSQQLGLNFSSRNLLDSAAGGTFMSITLGAATKLLDDMMVNYSEWHTERAPQGMKVNSVEETSSLSDKIDVIMSMLVNGRSNVDPNNVPLASLVAQEENVDVNFIKNNNFNNNAYRNNSGNNYRPYPSANSNGYGNSYGNSYNNNRSVPPGLEAMLKEFISTQTAFNKSVEEKLDKIDILATKVDRLASDVDLLKLKVMPNKDIDNKIVTTANAIQVRINENIRLMAELHARWEREENEKLAKENNVAKVWTITTTSNDNDSHVAKPPTINVKIIGVGNVSTPSAKRAKLPETAKTAKTACDKTAEFFFNVGDNDSIAVGHNDLDFDDCHISEVIKFLQKLAKSPNASAINLAFTKQITNALIKAREDKLKLETSIPQKLEDGWEPIIKMTVNDFDCNALCDLGASISIMPKKIYDMLDLPPLKNCYLDVNLADNAIKKPLGRIDNVRIMVNNNLVPVDFVVLDIECNASCPIILGRPFLRTIGATIDMKEGNIKYQFPLKKGMEHFPRKKMKLPYDSIIRTNYDVVASSLDNT